MPKNSQVAIISSRDGANIRTFVIDANFIASPSNLRSPADNRHALTLMTNQMLAASIELLFLFFVDSF